MGGQIPSENEWMIMEALWKNEGVPMTAAEIIRALDGVLEISPKTVRVMINRLVSKGMLGYTVDEHDTRIYHYHALWEREKCLAEKERRFVNNYFGGRASLAVASFLKSADISDDELEELQGLVNRLREKKDDSLF